MELDTPKIYEPIVDLDSLKERLQSFLQQYNEATRGGDVDLVFFKVCVIENFRTKLNRYFKKVQKSRTRDFERNNIPFKSCIKIPVPA